MKYVFIVMLSLFLAGCTAETTTVQKPQKECIKYEEQDVQRTIYQYRFKCGMCLSPKVEYACKFCYGDDVVTEKQNVCVEWKEVSN